MQGQRHRETRRRDLCDRVVISGWGGTQSAHSAGFSNVTCASLGDDRRVLLPRSHGLLLGLVIFITILAAGETVFGQSDVPVVESKEFPAASSAEKGSAEPTSQGVPVAINADRIEYDNDREEYHATGAVDIIRGPIHLNADEATLQKLTGRLTARGHVHLRDEKTDIWSEELRAQSQYRSGCDHQWQYFSQGAEFLCDGATPSAVF